MLWNEHSNLVGEHAFLGASKYHWINYTDDKIENLYLSEHAKEIGTRVHNVASELIKLGIKLPDNNKTLNMFVNDAISFKMNSEQVLYYSMNCFGTADAICFRNNTLRIHDLKTGKLPTHMEQLRIYAALFCLEYDFKPSDIEMELRIYQSNKIVTEISEPDIIVPIMDRIVTADKILNKIKEGI